MKVVHIIFGAHQEAEIIGLLHREIAVPDYLRLDGVTVAHEIERQGRRAYHSDDRNTLIVVVCEDDMAERIVQGVAALTRRVEHGLRAYAMPAEQTS